MPELPEVEVVRRGLERGVVGKTIRRVTGVHRRAVVGTTRRQFGARVRGGRFDQIARHGKFLLLHLSNDRTVIAHLRMSGKFLSVPNATLAPPYTRARIHLSDGSLLCYTDVRTLGNMRVVETAGLSADPSLSLLGPDALSPEFDVDHLRARTKRSRRQLKVFLLDQSNVAGIGNIYASEICFRAGLSPFRRAHRLTVKETTTLHRAIVEELQAGIEHGGTTFDVKSPNLYLDASGRAGRHGEHLNVYQRGGLPCKRCEGTVKRRVQQQRSTFWCPGCQG